MTLKRVRAARRPDGVGFGQGHKFRLEERCGGQFGCFSSQFVFPVVNDLRLNKAIKSIGSRGFLQENKGVWELVKEA